MGFIGAKCIKKQLQIYYSYILQQKNALVLDIFVFLCYSYRTGSACGRDAMWRDNAFT